MKNDKHERAFGVNITWLTQGSFLFESAGIRILIDPYMSDCLEEKGLYRIMEFPLSFEQLKPDLLICTHDHLDHLDPGTVKKIAAMYPDCLIAGPGSCCRHFRKLGVPEKQVRLLKQGNAFSLGHIFVTPVLAVHSDPDAIGVVFEAVGEKYYLSGDSLFDDALVNEFTMGCDVILICINGRLGNMAWDDAFKVVEVVNPVVALPMHYGLFAENTADPRLFIDQCRTVGVESFEMKPGEKIRVFR